MTEFLLYGLASYATESWQEELLLCTTDKAKVERVKVLALADGFHSFREAQYSGEKPDFTKVLNV